MKKLKKILFSVMIVSVFALTSLFSVGCSGQAGVNGADGLNGSDGSNGENGKNAYELFLQENDWYTGDLNMWLDDMANGRLAQRHDYSVIGYGSTVNADIISGEIAKDGFGFTMTDAILKLDETIVLPMTSSSDWTVSFKGVLLPDSAGGGEFLTTNAYGTNSRVYFGVNGTNQLLLFGVCINDIYANYAWSIPISTLNSEHAYDISFDGEQFLLSIDGGQQAGLDKVNINQNTSFMYSVDGVQASAEIIEKVHSIFAQDYLEFTYMGAFTHKLTLKMSYLGATTSGTYGYRKNFINPLTQKNIYYLGSSVTRGNGGNTDGTSFVEMISAVTGNTYSKEAVSGTTLAIMQSRNNSYVERLSLLDLTKNPDFFVMQLSTNDFSNSIEHGTVSESYASADMNKYTLTGAIEYIVAKVHEECPNTKIVIYACALNTNYGKYYEYGQYVSNELSRLLTKWQGVLYCVDLYNADYIYNSAYRQGDGLHPQREGYAQMWTPKIINFLLNLM